MTNPAKVTHLREVKGRNSEWMRGEMRRVIEAGHSLDQAILVIPHTREVIHCGANDLEAIGFLECLKQRLIDGLRDAGDAP